MMKKEKKVRGKKMNKFGELVYRFIEWLPPIEEKIFGIKEDKNGL